MRDKAFSTIETHRMFRQGDLVCAAVSGGADSVALLHFLYTNRQALGITLSACHLNHCLRGAEADRDEAFVRELCAGWGIPLTVERAEIAARARERRLSEEEAGREARYALFERLHRQTGCKVATAHTLSDNIETVLFSMVRGTGLRGMCGIAPVRDYLCRPLIGITRQEVEDYCRQQELDYVTDSTNADPHYTRNRLRLEVVPQLYAINPALPEAFSRLIEAMEEGYALVGAEAGRFLAEHGTDGRVDTAAFLAAPGAVQREVLARLAGKWGAGLSARHTELCRELAAGSGAVEIGGGIRFLSRGGRLWFEREPVPARSWEIGTSLAELRRGPLPLPDGRVLHAAFSRCEYFEKIEKDFDGCLKNTLDCDRIYGKIVLRTRRGGETLRPPGRGVTKTLKALLQEAGIPPAGRGRLVLLTDEAGVLWAEGFGCDERAAALPGQGGETVTIWIEENPL